MAVLVAVVERHYVVPIGNGRTSCRFWWLLVAGCIIIIALMTLRAA
jgi:hypothetical protein